ncbi:MAG: EAL domain-containing protein [Roseibium sp.]|uniref:putative bifunctional diguanylate cyclase/phosphodiesterase n=1 Tax=Roseibium sp. TaxID=1936156 RepID=UPI0032968CF5
MRFERLLKLLFPALWGGLALAAGLAALALLPAGEDTKLTRILQHGLALALLIAAVIWIRHVNARSKTWKNRARENAAQAQDLALRLNHDNATGLINHKVFAERVRAAATGLSGNQTLCVVSIDLESRWPSGTTFTTAKDEALLAASTDLMRHVADRLEVCYCLARSAGKGFSLMVAFDEDQGVSAPDIAKAITDVFLRPVQTALGASLISPVIGYAVSNTPDQDTAELINNANLAVANASETSRWRTVAYKPIMREELDRRTIVENALSSAIEANDCLPHFQPQFNLTTGRIYGVEALARWYHSDLGWISPLEFIPIAEGNGDIISLGWRILETSCSEVQLLPGDLSLSVNLSVAQLLSDDVMTMLEECLDRSGLPASRLKLEVTEATLMSDLKRVQTILNELRAFGVGISLDDFGAGYSALSYLTDFHWDEIKIDRSLATRAVKDAKQREILKLVLGIAETMGSEVMIEGIETVEQRDILVDLGCTRGQGYLFGGPMAIDDISTLFFPERQRLAQARISGISRLP